MPNIALVLKQEIARVARKALRTENERLVKTVASQRADIAELKRRTQALEAQLRQLGRTRGRPAVAEAAPQEGGKAPRFSAKGMASNRKRLGLSAADFGLLVGTTGQSVYAWESGRTQPRAKQVAAIAALRGIGKKEVAARLAALQAQA